MDFQLEKHVKELLFRYNMVIIPGFGALIGSRKPAKVDRRTGLFEPPAKFLSFNSILKENDGLLINHVAKKNRITVHQAEEKVRQAVAEWKNELNRNGQIGLEDIGFFIKNNDKIIFSPYSKINYLTEAFGLKTFIRKPIEKPEEEHIVSFEKSVENKSVSQADKKILILQSHNLQNNESKKWLKYAAAAVVALGIIAGGLKSSNLWIKQHAPVNQATYITPERLPEIIITKKNDQPSVNPETKINTHSYYIIVGAFKSKANAEKLIKKLQDHGINASIPGKNEKGLYYVAYAKENSEIRAGILLNNIKDQFKGAWILKIEK